MQYITNSEKETKKLAKKLSLNLKDHIIALTGELGAGKTVFVQGFAKGLGIKDKIISPTFVLIRQHQIPHTNKILYHIDLYRLEDIKDFQQLGLEEILSDPNHVILIEWAEKIKDFLPQDIIKISIEKLDENRRVITID